MYPETFVSYVKKTFKKNAKLTLEILEEKALKKQGFGALIGVGQGSINPPRFVRMAYKSKGAKFHLALVGKGITFDTGGISLKPPASMHTMKCDMAGAATVVEALRAIMQLDLKINVTAYAALAENMPSASAQRPSDVVTTFGGKTIEVLNTDAEGRLILCDALTYAEKFEPSAVIDIATLTGACVIALGHHVSAVFSNQDRLAKEILSAGEDALDRAWHMPMWEEYQSQLDSNFADIANIGGRAGGSITAACFLSRFAKKYHWAHLDIAGTAWKSGKEKGSTGRPVPLLTQFLKHRAEKA
jgi:leucyl aminopeptidase